MLRFKFLILLVLKIEPCRVDALKVISTLHHYLLRCVAQRLNVTVIYTISSSNKLPMGLKGLKLNAFETLTLVRYVKIPNILISL